MTTITLLNEKGGVGKTTLAVHIAAGLAVIGLRVVLVDADPQANATLLLNSAPRPGLYDLLVRNARFRDVLGVVPPEVYEPPNKKAKGELLLLPGNVETRNIASAIDDATLVAQRFAELEQYQVDAVIVDTSPTPSLLHGAIYLATDAILYPTTCQYLPFMGLMASLRHREEADKKRSEIGLRGIRVMGIVPTMYQGRTVEQSENLTQLQTAYGNMVWDALPHRTLWQEAATLRRAVWGIAPRSAAAKEAWKLAAKVMEGVTA